MAAEARRITGRHLLLDGPGAILEIAPEALAPVLSRLGRGLAALGWGTLPAHREHRQGVSVGVRAPCDQLRAAVELLEWAADDEDEEGLESLVRRAARRADPALRALVEAFPGRVLVGEGLVTVGLGVHARSYDPDALPSVEGLSAGRVPMAMITGTNGKTTTTRLLAHIASVAGLTAGRTSSDGVVIGDEVVERGDWTGPGAARRVLRDTRVEVAVLETARGGLLRRGLVADGAQVAVLTNVTPEHLGEWGVDDLETMARAKLVIADGLCPGGTLVVPATSAPIGAVLPDLRARRPDLVVRTFSGAPGADGWADAAWLHVGGGRVPLAEIPITFDGTARHNVENALAASLAALALGLPGAAISRGLRSFRPSAKDNPGRMNTYRLPSGALVVIDFAHNADGLRRIAETVRLWPKARRTLLLGQAGDRPDEDLRALAAAALPLAAHRVVLKEVSRRRYDRAPGEVPAVLREALLAGGLPAARLDGPTPDEATGVRLAIRGATRDDVVVLLLHETLAEAAAILAEAGAVSIDP